MHRTTVRLDERLLQEVKALGARSGRTLTALIEDALREMLARELRSQDRKRVRLPVFGGRGLRAGVDLDDSATLLDWMEARGGAA